MHVYALYNKVGGDSQVYIGFQVVGLAHPMSKRPYYVSSMMIHGGHTIVSRFGVPQDQAKKMWYFCLSLE